MIAGGKIELGNPVLMRKLAKGEIDTGFANK